MSTIITRLYHSPCGPLQLGTYSEALCLCSWLSSARREPVLHRLKRLLGADFKEGTSATIDRTMAQLDEYFARQRTAFDIPLLLAGTDFQKSAWEALCTIPYGETRSYAVQAAQTGRPKAVRAVANANSLNAIAIIVPCHRVVGSNHQLTGYAGGLDIKKALLELERQDCFFRGQDL